MAEHILVQDIVPRIQYTADGINKTFETPFIIFNEDALDVYLDEEKITQGYTIQMDDEMRGQVVFETAPENGTLITLSRHLTIARTSDFQEGGSLRANTLNYELDYQTACLQELADNINRSMVLPPYAVGSDTQLTLPTPNPGKSIVWSQDGTYLENSVVNINAVSAELDAKVNASSQNAASSQLSSQLAQNMAVLAQTKAELAEDQASIATQKAQEVTNALSQKAGVDLTNITSAGASLICNLPLASDECVDLTLSASQKYTCPANGYFYVSKASSNSNQYIAVYNETSGLALGEFASNWSGQNIRLFVPAKKDDVCYWTGTFGGTTWGIKFIYAQGETV